MKIVIINQPINNRGDEAAHKSLVRNIINTLPNVTITVIFFDVDNKSIKEMNIQDNKIKYISIHSERGSMRLMKFALKFNLERLIINITPSLNKYFSYIKNADIVISAPGGICLGGFQNWNHLLNLQFSMILKKKIIYYSRSIGPFSETTKKNRLFKKYSLNLLRYFSFLSIRDTISMKLLKELGIPYYPSIDTAFLDDPKITIPTDILTNLSDDYIVFVPNSLTWHPDFKDINQQRIDNIYIEIICLLLQKCPTYKIILLPQLFNDEDKSDAKYFLKLSRLVNSTSIICLPETICSDIQQQIIANAKFVIGARYHSIVFAINNEVPFISLSYEHKMSGLLELLSLSYREVNIKSIRIKDFQANEIFQGIEKLLSSTYDPKKPKIIARKMAIECFDQMIKIANNG